MTMSDLPEVECIQAANPTASQWNAIDYLGYRTWIAESDGRAVGFLCLQPLPIRADGRTEAEILNLAVDPAFKRRGIATALMGKVDFDVVYLDVRANNRPALEFYRKFGFRKTGHRRRYYNHPVEDSVMMTRG